MTQDHSLSEHEAYLAMYAFLSSYNERGRSDEVGALLGSLSLLSNGSPADPALALDWQQACRAVRAGKVDAQMKLR
jgi:hypothetical protein